MHCGGEGTIITSKNWLVQIKGDIHDKESDYELSVVREDNRHGQISYGWGGPKKIILFGTGASNRISPRTPEDVAFALSVAEKLRLALNEDAPQPATPSPSPPKPIYENEKHQDQAV